MSLEVRINWMDSALINIDWRCVCGETHRDYVIDMSEDEELLECKRCKRRYKPEIRVKVSLREVKR